MKALSLFYNTPVEIQNMPKVKPAIRYEGVMVSSKLDYAKRIIKGNIVTDLSLEDWCFFNAYTLIHSGYSRMIARSNEFTALG